MTMPIPATAILSEAARPHVPRAIVLRWRLSGSAAGELCGRTWPAPAAVLEVVVDLAAGAIAASLLDGERRTAIPCSSLGLDASALEGLEVNGGVGRAGEAAWHAIVDRALRCTLVERDGGPPLAHVALPALARLGGGRYRFESARLVRG